MAEKERIPANAADSGQDDSGERLGDCDRCQGYLCAGCPFGAKLRAGRWAMALLEQLGAPPPPGSPGTEVAEGGNLQEGGWGGG